ncbi:tetratricopeptide repeat protein [Planomonospora algeriensis]
MNISLEVTEWARWALAAALQGDEEGRAALDHLRGPLTAAAEAGDAEAQSVLGGIALEHDNDSGAALRLWRLAAHQGHPAGQRGLGHLYASGLGVPQDFEKAVSLFQAAAAAGDPEAMYNLAMLHLRGKVAERMSSDEVMALLRSAAACGIKEANARLGDWFSALDRDEEALRWYLAAAEGGHAGAMFAVGIRYRDGIGAGRDAVQAVRWFLKMLDVGNGDGVHEAIELARSVTDDQIREAAGLAGREADGESLISVVRRPQP